MTAAGQTATDACLLVSRETFCLELTDPLPAKASPTNSASDIDQNRSNVTSLGSTNALGAMERVVCSDLHFSRSKSIQLRHFLRHPVSDLLFDLYQRLSGEQEEEESSHTPQASRISWLPHWHPTGSGLTSTDRDLHGRSSSSAHSLQSI